MKFKSILFLAVILMATSCGSSGKKKVLIETSYGNMTVELYDSTPLHRDNFIKLVNDDFYNGLLFHRIISGFMVQGGDPNSRDAKPGQRLGSGGPGYKVDAEIGSPHFKGTLAAARQGGAANPQKKSSGSQFYITHGRPQSDQQLNTMEASKNIKYTDEQRARYKKFGGTPQLDMDYTVFGEVIDGLDVIDKIAAVKKDQSDRPLEDVKMKISVIN